MLREQLVDRPVDADIDAAMEGHALPCIWRDAGVDRVLLHLEVRDAEAQQAAGLRFALIDMHVMPGAAELLRGRETRRPGADDRDRLARLALPPAADG
jgi:hypothetical protein